MDRENVIKELKDIRDSIAIGQINGTYKMIVTINNALELLKEQEAKPLRCKECSYHRNDGWCNEHGREVKESDYCSFGAWEGR